MEGQRRIAPPAPEMGYYTEGEGTVMKIADGYEGGGGRKREGYNLGERVKGKDLRDSRQEGEISRKEAGS